MALPSDTRYATEPDWRECRQLHRAHGTTYFLASRLFPKPIQRHVDALYGFVRVADEWVDNPQPHDTRSPLYLLGAFRDELRCGLQGKCPSHPVLRAFCDTVREKRIPQTEPELFLDAMEADATVGRYAEYSDLQSYMRGSAVAVAYMMCAILDVPDDPAVRGGAAALAEAMQMTNFLRDVGEDLDRGRVYLPEGDLKRFGLEPGMLQTRKVTQEFRQAMQFQIERTRRLYAHSDPYIACLPSYAVKPVRLARELYSRILGRIEANCYDVFTKRARTSRSEKALAMVKVITGR